MTIYTYVYILLYLSFVDADYADQEKPGCSLKQIETLAITECEDGESVFVPGALDFVRSGTVCLFKHHQVYDTRTCSNGMWLTAYQIISYAPKRRVKRGFFRWLGCLFSRCSHSDRTPPSVICPPSQILDADPMQTHKTDVTWKSATATDDRDGTRPTTLRGKVSGSKFSEGTFWITYESHDRAGNRGSCSFSITVIVHRCPAPTPITNGYYICHPSTDFVQGTRCIFGCYDGFELEPRHVTSKTCLTTEDWDNTQPMCKAFECPPLPAVDGATFQCTNDRYFRSICTYRCKTGYAMPPGVSATLVCAINKRWRGYGQPECVDIIRPTFLTCPSIVIVGTDDAVKTATVNWIPPTVEDNSAGNINLRQARGSALGSKLTAGTYTIEYEAEDEAGNLALPCTFKVVVRDVRCPKLYATPYTNFHCAHGYRSGVLCNITCDPGKVMDGEDFVICKRSVNGLYGEWQWIGEQTRCNSTNKCQQIPAPKNGAVACDNWIGGKFCQVQCRKDTYIHSSSNWKGIQTCSKTGNWIPTLARGPCEEPRGGADSSLAVSIHYNFVGDCSNETTRIQIREHFVSALNNSLFALQTCTTQADKCIAQKVQVRCGASDRRKRSGGTDSTAEPSVTKTTFRNTYLHVSFQVSLNTTESLSKEDTVLQYTAMFRHLKTSLTSPVIQLPESHVMLELDDIVNSGLTLTCPKGSVLSNQSFSCVECPEGTYYNEARSICHECRKGTYQNQTGQSTCLDCPSTTTTRAAGVTDQTDCEAACEPGYRSEHGVVPCSFCEVGTYNTGYGNQACTRCPGSTSTLTEGSDNILDCKEFDIVFTTGESTNVHLILNETVNSSDIFATFWIQSLNMTSSDFSFRLMDSEDVTMVSLEQRAQQMDLEHNGTKYQILEQATPDTRWHFVEVILQDCTLTVRIDGCNVTSPNVVACDDIHLISVTISTEINFDGRLSQLNLWSRRQYRSISSQRTCFHDNTGDVLSWQDFNDAQMDGAYMDLDSLCDDFDNCASSPCINGTCSDAVHGFTCKCVEGYTGSTCSDNIDDCQANMCMNGGSCIDGVTIYMCTCLPTYTGEFCEIEMVHGQWGEWSNYTECSTTCGLGSKQRFRLCDSPIPDNGGSKCIGNNTDMSDCNLQLCRTCVELVAPDHGSLSCDTDADNHTCTISCDPGYEFDIPPMNAYFCGPDTFHVWNFDSPDNPLRRFPQCTQIHTPSQLTVTYSAKYKDWACAADNDVLIRAKLDTVISKLPCIQNATCTVANVTTNICNTGDRQTRSAGVSGFVVTLQTQPKNINGSGTLFGLQGAIETLQAAVEAGDMTVKHNGKTYVIDIHTTVGGVVTCRNGFVKAYHYCVACGRGSYFNIDYCERCDVGTYQDEEGKTACKSCPEGKSTLGLGSVNYTDCTGLSVYDPADMDMSDNSLLVGLLTGSLTGGVVVVVVVITFCIRRNKTKKKKHVINREVESDNVSSLASKERYIQDTNFDPARLS